MTPDTSVPVHFLNIDYFFRIIYETVLGLRGPTFQTDLMSLLAHFWIWVTVVSFMVTCGILAVFIYAFLRYRQVADAEAAQYATVHDAHHAEEVVEQSRWQHVLTLIESAHENDWRQSIIEADIILYDALDDAGYMGASIGDKLKGADPRRLGSLQEAWDAHKVRNDIAHQGSAFALTDHIAYRTIQKYETVLRELGEIE